MFFFCNNHNLFIRYTEKTFIFIFFIHLNMFLIQFLYKFFSANAKPLAPADILFTIILTHCVSGEPGNLQSFQVLLSGTEQDPKCLPHAVHIVTLFENVVLVHLVEVGDPLVSGKIVFFLL